MVEEYKKKKMQEFEIIDLGLMRYFFGIQVKQSEVEIFISQEKYVDDFLKKFHVENRKPVATPLEMNEKLQQDLLIYLTNTRPHIVHSVSYVLQFMSELSKLHFAAEKRILRYLQGTNKQG